MNYTYCLTPKKWRFKMKQIKIEKNRQSAGGWSKPVAEVCRCMFSFLWPDVDSFVSCDVFVISITFTQYKTFSVHRSWRSAESDLWASGTSGANSQSSHCDGFFLWGEPVLITLFWSRPRPLSPPHSFLLTVKHVIYDIYLSNDVHFLWVRSVILYTL